MTATRTRLPPFERLVAEHAALLRRVLAASVGADAADDCLQETLLAALRAYPDLEDDRNLRGWLLTIAARKALDHHRRQRRRPVVPLDAVAEPAAAEASPPPDSTLWAAVARLPPRQRTTIALRFVADLPYADVAVLVGCSEDAARQNARAGLATLRQGWNP